MKTLAKLRGIAIIAVVLGHAIDWVYWGQDQWLNQIGGGLSAPFESQVGTLTYHVLKIVYLLIKFDVPLFLFASGFFAAFAVQARSKVDWHTVGRWIGTLVWPFTIWMTLYTLTSWLPVALTGDVSFSDLLSRSLVALNLAFFIPLLVQFYLLTPIMARMVKTRWWLLLALAGSLQFIGIGLWYYQRLGFDLNPAIQGFRELSSFFFWGWAIYYPLGMVFGVYYPRLLGWLKQHICQLWLLVIGSALVSILELEFLARDGLILEPTHYSFWVTGYTLAIILLFMTLGDRWLPFSRRLTDIGVKSLGVYLGHSLVLLAVFRVIKLTFPALLFSPLLFLSLLFFSSLGLSLILGAFLAHHAKHSVYRFLFG